MNKEKFKQWIDGYIKHFDNHTFESKINNAYIDGAKDMLIRINEAIDEGDFDNK